MNFPDELDPLTVTSITLNPYYFDDNSHHDIAEEVISRVFPNAEVVWFGDMEDLSSGVFNISPLPEAISDRWQEINSALEDMLPQGRHRGDARWNSDNYEDGQFIYPRLLPDCDADDSVQDSLPPVRP